MKRALLAAAGGIVLALACAAGAARANDAQLRVLFIGNSLTATQTNATGEDLPSVLGRMASGRSKTLSLGRAILPFVKLEWLSIFGGLLFVVGLYYLIKGGGSSKSE